MRTNSAGTSFFILRAFVLWEIYLIVNFFRFLRVLVFLLRSLFMSIKHPSKYYKTSGRSMNRANMNARISVYMHFWVQLLKRERTIMLHLRDGKCEWEIDSRSTRPFIARRRQASVLVRHCVILSAGSKEHYSRRNITFWAVLVWQTWGKGH